MFGDFANRQRVCSCARQHVSMKAFYPNFPAHVMEASEVTLYFNALLHYWSSGTSIPHTEKQERPYIHYRTPMHDEPIAILTMVEVVFFI